MYGLRGDPSDDPSTALLASTLDQAKQGAGSAGLLSLLLMAGVAFLVFRPARR